MSLPTIEQQTSRLLRFVVWLDRFGELSYDHQSFFASDRTRKIKNFYYKKPLLGTALVAPIIFCEAFAPWMRTRFWKPQRFPIADAHYAMGFAYLSRALDRDDYYSRAVHFLDVLQATRSAGYEHHCWGYPFDWQTRNGTIAAGTPLITTVPYVYEAFQAVHELDGDPRWLAIMHSIAEHAQNDYRDHAISPGVATCAYTPSPEDPGKVVNASAYRSFLLTRASHDLAEPRYLEAADRNLQYVLNAQNEDGSWPYATDGVRPFVDHFHTCFVMKSLAKIALLTGNAKCLAAIARGVRYYVQNLFDEDGMPRPFSKRPRITVYRNELYDIAEFINLAVLLRHRFQELEALLPGVTRLDGWQKPDGSFRSRRLLIGWDNVPMHRWAQAQLFRSLSLLLLLEVRPERMPYKQLEGVGKS
jgi:hypothetical protein